MKLADDIKRHRIEGGFTAIANLGGDGAPDIDSDILGERGR